MVNVFYNWIACQEAVIITSIICLAVSRRARTRNHSKFHSCLSMTLGYRWTRTTACSKSFGSRLYSALRTDFRGGSSLRKGRKAEATCCGSLHKNTATKHVGSDIHAFDGEFDIQSYFGMAVESLKRHDEYFVGFIDFHLFGGLFELLALVAIPTVLLL